MAAYSSSELVDACQAKGCPICRLVKRSIEGYFANLFYENVNDRDVRRGLRQSLGFCNAHAWMLLEGGLGDALGVAIIYHDLLTNVLRRLPEGVAVPPAPGGFLAGLAKAPRYLAERIKAMVQAITPQGPCPACQQRDNTTQILLTVFLAHLEDDRLAKAFNASAGLCLPHLRQALALVKDEKGFQLLVAESRKQLAALDGELAEIIRKNDYRFHAEGFGAEKDAWLRVIGIASGGKDLGV